MHLRHAATLTVAAVTLGGCSTLRERFPSHEAVFTPISTSLGVRRIQGADTSFVLEGPGYQAVTAKRNLLPDAKVVLDRTASAHARFFAAEPPLVTVRLLVGDRRRGGSAAGVKPSDSGQRDVTVRVWLENDRNARMAPMGGMRDFAIALPVARTWLRALTDVRRGATAAPDSARHLDADERIADWIERSIPRLIAGAPDVERLTLALAEHPETVVPVREFITATRAGAVRDRAERANDPDEIDPGDRQGSVRGRGQGRLGGAALFDAQAVAFAQYVVEREGRAFLGRLVVAIIEGARFEDALADAQNLPRELNALDRDWREWLARQATAARDRRSGR